MAAALGVGLPHGRTAQNTLISLSNPGPIISHNPALFGCADGQHHRAVPWRVTRNVVSRFRTISPSNVASPTISAGSALAIKNQIQYPDQWPVALSRDPFTRMLAGLTVCHAPVIFSARYRALSSG